MQLGIKSRLKESTKRVLASMGYFLGRHPQTYSLENHLLQVCTQLRINCILDVGAHYGEFAQRVRDAGYRGRVVSFEPVHESFSTLRRARARDPDWRGFEVALGDSDGTATVNVLQDSVFTSLLSPNAFGTDRFAGKMHVQETRSVPIRALDSLWTECMKGIDEPRVFLKLDTQGYDLIVLRGATAHLNQIDALQLELAAQPIYTGASNELSEAITTLRKLGFRLCGLYPVTWDPGDKLTAIEIDGLFWKHRGPDSLA
jgi:FkbM family methyltransferase